MCIECLESHKSGELKAGCCGGRRLPAAHAISCWFTVKLPIEVATRAEQNACRAIIPNGSRGETQACANCAMCGRLRVGKSFFYVLQHWSVQPCVRPLGAVHMTAGHNALRGSGPGQKHAFDSNAMAQVGCPDCRIDRLCITCCSPSQPSHHARCPARSRLPR